MHLSQSLQIYLSFLTEEGYAPTAETVQLYVDDVLQHMTNKEFPEFIKQIPPTDQIASNLDRNVLIQCLTDTFTKTRVKLKF